MLSFKSSFKVTKAAIVCIKPVTASQEVALFVTYAPNGVLKDHIHHYLYALRQQKISVVLIVAVDNLNINIPSILKDNVDGLFVRENLGFDFAAWAHLFHHHPQFYKAQTIYLLNDSVIGPINNVLFDQLIAKIRASTADFIGLTDNFEQYILPWHLQSYFFVIKTAVLSSLVFQKFMKGIVSYKNKDDVIKRYEARLTEKLSSSGLSCEVMFPSTTIFNPTTIHWRELLRQGFPFLKISVTQDYYPLVVDNRGWKEELHRQCCELQAPPIHTCLSALSVDDKQNEQASSIAVYQIFYLEKQRKLLEQEFTPYNNSKSFSPGLCEYGVFKKMFDMSLHKKHKLLGALSWKFRMKTKMQGKEFIDFIKNNPGQDVYFINPFPGEAIHSNVWKQGEIHHPNLTSLAQVILTGVNYNIDLSKTRNDATTTAYCNYWVGNESFWEKYMNFTLPIYNYILYDSPLYIRKKILEERADKKIKASYFPFIMERLFSLLLVTDPSIRYMNVKFD